MSVDIIESTGIELSIEDYYFVSDGSCYDQHYFIIHVRIEEHKYSVDRSYLEFVELDRVFHKIFPQSEVPTLPLRAASYLQQYLCGQETKKKMSGTNKTEERRKSIVTRESLTPTKQSEYGGTKNYLQILDSTEIIRNRIEPLNKYLGGVLRHHELLASTFLKTFLDEEVTSIFETSLPPSLTEYDLLLINSPLTVCMVHKSEQRAFDAPENSILLWRFIVTDFDIGFSVQVENEIKLPLTRYRSTQGTICGAVQVVKSARCLLKWDNSYAKLHSKELTWSACVVSLDDFIDAKKRALACEQEKKRFERQRHALSRAVSRLAAEKSGIIHGSIIEAEYAEEVEIAAHHLDSLVLTLTEKNETLVADLNEAEHRIDDLENRLEESEKSKDVIADSWHRASTEIDNLQHEIYSLHQELEDMENLLLEKEAYNLNLLSRVQYGENRDNANDSYLEKLLENIQVLLNAFQRQYLDATEVSKSREMEYRKHLVGIGDPNTDTTVKIENLHSLVGNLLGDLHQRNSSLHENTMVLNDIKKDLAQLRESLLYKEVDPVDVHHED